MSDSFNKSKPGSSATLGLRRFISRFKDGGPATASSTQQAQQVLQGDAPVHSEGAPQAEIIEKDARNKETSSTWKVEPLSSAPSTFSVFSRHDRRVQTTNAASHLTESDLGFKVLVSGTNPTVDVIAVHGLNGHREKTWTASNGTFWLRDLLPSAFENVRVITYGYDARTHGSRYMTVQFLYDHAIDFVASLCALRRYTKTQERPIVFLAHSLGGILVKGALIHSSFSTPQHLSDHMSIKLSTYGIFFFGTPHAGSGGAAWATSLLKIGSIFAKTNTAVVKHLKSNSEWLRQQVDQFTGISNNFKMIFCYEGYPTPLALGTSSVIVSRESAIIAGIRNSEVLSFAKDHKELVRFAGSDDEDFKSIISHLNTMIEDCQDAVARAWSRQEAAESYLVDQRVTTSSEIYKLPPRLGNRNPCFIGRRNHLAQIQSNLFPPLSGRSQTKAVDGHVVILYGLGGMGKTQLALTYAAEYADEFSAIWYVDSSSESSARLGFREIAQRYIERTAILSDGEERQRALQSFQLTPYLLPNGHLSDDSVHLPAITKAVNGILEQDGNDKWLLILDNMDDLEKISVEEFLPKTLARRVIITTRSTAAIRLGYAVEVDGVEEDEGVSILLNSARLRVPMKSDDLFAKEVVKILGYLPLAIEQAGAYISDVQIRLDEYLPLYKRHRRDLLQRVSLCDIYNHRKQTVYTTWEVSYEMLEIQDSAAAEMLLLLAFFHYETIWEGIFELAIGRDNEDAGTEHPADMSWLIDLYKNRFAFNSAIGKIMSFSLAKRGLAPPPGVIRLHPLVHSWSRDKLSAPKRQRNGIHALFVIGKASETLSKNPSMDEDSSSKRRLLSNADACLGFIKSDAISNIFQLFILEPGGLKALYSIANLYFEFGRLHQVADLLKHVANHEPDSSETESSETGIRVQCQSRLAEVFEQLGKLEEAKTLYEDSMVKSTKLYSDTDPRVLAAMGGLGTVLWEMRRVQEARKLLENLLFTISKSAFGLGEVGRKAGSTLSLVYGTLGMIDEAVASQRQVLDDITADSSVNILSTLEPRYRMALVLQMSGEWSQAVELFSEVFILRLKLLGPETLDTARAANAFGRSLCFLGKYAKSREMLDFAWKQQQKMKLGITHRAMLRTLYNIGVLNREEGLYDEALELLEHASVLYLKLGEWHHSYLLTQIGLAELKKECGQPQEAVTILEKVRLTQQKDLLPEQAECIRAIIVMAQSLLQLGEDVRAESILAETKNISSHFLTPDHPETLAIHVTEAAIRLEQNRGAEVLDDLKDTISRLERVLGKEHKDMILATVLLGRIYLQTGLVEQGIEQIKLSTKALKDCLGTNHPKVRRLVELQATSIESLQWLDVKKREERELDGTMTHYDNT